MSIDARLLGVPRRLRAARVRNGWSLQEASRRCGLSAAHLSRLESGQRQLSIAVLLRLADCYAEPVTALLTEGVASPQAVIRGSEARGVGGDGIVFASLTSPQASPLLRALRVTVQAERRPGPPACHDGEEWLYVLSGVLRLELDDVAEILLAGDAAHFDASRAHRLRSGDGCPVEVLLVAAAGSADLTVVHS
jgi:transcriptional regulator with XRE-family HTH domain